MKRLSEWGTGRPQTNALHYNVCRERERERDCIPSVKWPCCYDLEVSIIPRKLHGSQGFSPLDHYLWNLCREELRKAPRNFSMVFFILFAVEKLLSEWNFGRRMLEHHLEWKALDSFCLREQLKLCMN